MSIHLYTKYKTVMRSETRAWIFVTFFQSHPNGGGSWMVDSVMIFWIEELGVMMGPEESLNRKSSKKRW